MSKKNKTKEPTAEPTTPAEPKPVRVSGEATKVLANRVRRWSGWPKATLVWDKPTVSPWAETSMATQKVTADIDSLILNPHRVLFTVTPFRLRQEAVLTGALLHECGHARHTGWLPHYKDQIPNMRHRDDTPVSDATRALAMLVEEPRIEGRIAAEADMIGAFGLGWTMRAMAAHLLPTTRLHIDPNQALMDLIQSWVLRAGRQVALNLWTKRSIPLWVGDFTALLHASLAEHFEGLGDANGVAANKAVSVVNLLHLMLHCHDDKGTTMVDLARDILTLLFPETDADDQPQASGGCSMPMPMSAEGSEDTDSKGSGKGEDGDESDDDGSGDQKDDDEENEPESGDSEGDPETGDADDQEDDGSGASDSTDSDKRGDDDTLQEQLSQMEEQASAQVETETEAEAKAPPMAEPGSGAGVGKGSDGGGRFRPPTAAERDVQRNAERFLRSLVDPSEAAKVVLTETPSATVDPAAMAAWRAGGGTRDPLFFRRTRREVSPQPPIKIAILVDVSASMSVLQKPSAMLSWALASACLDLRNFAGRGVQVESTLIHWGSGARVIQRNGQTLPGIREVPCDEGTSVMDQALDLADEELPGFLDGTDKMTNRLLVQFTDWQLMGGNHRQRVIERMSRALASGVNMISVVPSRYSPRSGDLSDILAACRTQRGSSSLLKYNPMFPEQVWDHAAEVLSGGGAKAAPFPGF